MLGWCAEDATGKLQRQLHIQVFGQDTGRDLITIRTAVILEEMKFHSYTYTFQTTRNVLSRLADVYSAGA